ncbi:hypothetical protein FOA43_001900 [Brettanomyces nanus]|uniref:Mitochondrial escape protein 2 n=1 Tax=Eeniella nana TaxID=13502 RepID=A0A875S466_EENNA|nr:uncharacterized protein FOA43_001900 [Brettanomyces nanus]QPG74569.1 hypothetical protein FOA43_001900 [Brettanomyces nanus]
MTIWKESLLYYDRLIPMRSGKWDLRQLFLPFLYDMSESGLRARVLKLSSGQRNENSENGGSENKTLNLDITKFTSVTRDGGAFVKFKVPDGMAVSEFNKQIMDNVAQRASGSFLDKLTHPRCFPVKGTPWIEDLARFPSSQLKVEFEGPDLTQENIYALFRRYGPISDIDPPSPDSKSVPRHAIITFHNTRAAVTARQCLNGLQAGDTMLHIQYRRIMKENAVFEFIGAHSRIFIPLFLALLAGFAVVIFDPIRSFFVSEKITSDYSFKKMKIYQEIMRKFSSTKRKMSRILSLNSGMSEDDEGWNSIEGLREERDEKAKSINICLEENVNSFIVVQGPPGSGKRSLVQEQALKDRSNVLYIDCERIIKARNESDFIKNTASEIGYYPVFPWLTQMSSFTDLVVQGLAGQKSGMSETKEGQVKNMLTLAANVIRDVAMRNYSSDEGEHHLKEEDYLRQNPDAKPVIVIDRYQAARNSHDSNAFVYQALAEWAASLVTLDIAHVIFITDDVGSVQKLANIMPSAPLKRTILSDATHSAAENYVLKKLSRPANGADGEEKASEKRPSDTKELFMYIDRMGGRMLDLQMFVRRIQSGDSPSEAFEGLVNQAIEQLTQKMMQPKDDSYNSSQVWCLIKLLAKNGTVTFTDLQLLPLFKSHTNTLLQSIENAEVVSLIRNRGVIVEVQPAKPLYEAAFQEMISQPTIFNSIESDYLKTLISQEAAKVMKMEEDVANYRGIENSKIFRDRLDYLSHKINTSTKSIATWEKELASLSLPDKK